MDIDQKYLASTKIIDSDNEITIGYAMDVVGTTKDMIEKAVKLYYAVRDRIWYDPYYPFYLPEHYQASNIIKSGRGFCISKAGLLCALGRVCQIPTRVGFATVCNHLATTKLIERMGGNLFVYHGFTEFYLDGKWVKATPAFNVELCEKHKVNPLEFTGREDSIFHSYNSEKKKYMEYIAYHGSYTDIPVSTILLAWEKAYGKERVNKWITDSGEKDTSDFYREEIAKD